MYNSVITPARNVKSTEGNKKKIRKKHINRSNKGNQYLYTGKNLFAILILFVLLSLGFTSAVPLRVLWFLSSSR
jgi:hypothetical protein